MLRFMLVHNERNWYQMGLVNALNYGLQPWYVWWDWACKSWCVKISELNVWFIDFVVRVLRDWKGVIVRGVKGWKVVNFGFYEDADYDLNSSYLRIWLGKTFGFCKVTKFWE